MRYIIMCGGRIVPNPRQLREINGERIVGRTIRLLREQGIEDIVISAQDERFTKFGVPVVDKKWDRYYWLNCFIPSRQPVCYLYGDVYYSPEAIRTIVSTETDDIEFFASAKPFSDKYIKQWEEPFAFKVQRTRHFRNCINKTKQYFDNHVIGRAISWELWQVIKGTPLRVIEYNYTVINDYTCDIDNDREAEELQRCLSI